MMNNAIALQFLKLDWEAQRIAYDLARSSEFVVPSPHVIPILTSFEFIPNSEDPTDSKTRPVKAASVAAKVC